MSNVVNILDFSDFYLVGVKGVAMTALAQCLLDAGKRVSGSDVEGEFVTQQILVDRGIKIDVGFEGEVPSSTDCVIFTAAHQGKFNPQVQKATAQGILTLSHAEALGSLFNQKQGIAVCGVGGKSTTSAMISWILDKTGHQPSYAIGVGNIPGLNKTGQWVSQSPYFVGEADEYVTDPSAPSRGESITPRFSFLHPLVTVCTNLKFDHPDVYRNFEHTLAVYESFFKGMKNGGTLVVNSDDQPLLKLAQAVTESSDLTCVTYGENPESDLTVGDTRVGDGKTMTSFTYQAQAYELELSIPGRFNAYNGLAAVTACAAVGVPVSESVAALASFRSTMRRSEFIGEKSGVKYYDDYAHHPTEVKNIIHAFKEWFPQTKVLIAFQSHTFSRTKSLFNDFVDAFAEADEVAMIDIFASAREAFDPSVTSEMLCQAIESKYPQVKAVNYHTVEELAAYLQATLKPGEVCLSVGAGTIYEVHHHLK